MPTAIPDEVNDPNASGLISDTGAAVEVMDGKPEQAPGCPNCGFANYSSASWCKSCGYYALMGRCIELEDWERESTNGEQEVAEKPKAVWCSVPIWAWQFAAVFVAVTAISLAGRYYTVADTTPRVTWAVAQLALGLIAFLVAHVWIAKTVLGDDASVGILDVIASPLRVWIGACADFDRLSRWMALGIGGIWSVVLAHVLLGIPYGSLFTHEEPPLREEQTGGAGGERKGVGGAAGGKQKSMEQAMNEFGERSGAKGMAKKANEKKAKPRGQPVKANEKEEDKPEIRDLDCLIVGYMPGKDGTNLIEALVLAVKREGEWKVVGTVSEGLTPEIQRDLSIAAQPLHRQQPIVKSEYSAIWLEPVLHCLVEAEFQPKQDIPSSITMIGLQ
jgi:hypothetical protein